MVERPTVLVDACSLASALGRNILLSLAEAGLFEIRWSRAILDEVERAISRILRARGRDDAASSARRARNAMERAFPSALVVRVRHLPSDFGPLPDPEDAHVMAAALACGAKTIVTENVGHFSATPLAARGLRIRTTDEFVAMSIEYSPDIALAALGRMRERFARPELTAEELVLRCIAAGFASTANALVAHGFTKGE